MKTTAKQLLAVLLALVMTVSFMTVMAVSTSAATTPVPVGTNGDIQGGTNHCEEFSTTYPDDPMPPVFERSSSSPSPSSTIPPCPNTP